MPAGAEEGVVGSEGADQANQRPFRRSTSVLSLEQRTSPGQKRPLKPKDTWTIQVRLQLEDRNRKRDLAMFNLAILFGNVFGA
jgi:hypothetical protein